MRTDKDEEIVKHIVRTGDHERFGILYDKYSDRVFGKCLSFVKDRDIAKDLLHDIFLKCFVNLSNFNFKSQFSTWLYSITYNYCVDFVRKRNRLKMTDWENIPEIKDETDEINEKELLSIKAERLKQVLENISPDIKMLLLMKYQDNLSIKDIMSATELGESAVKMRLKRSKEKALEKYKELYQEHEL